MSIRIIRGAYGAMYSYPQEYSGAETSTVVSELPQRNSTVLEQNTKETWQRRQSVKDAPPGSGFDRKAVKFHKLIRRSTGRVEWHVSVEVSWSSFLHCGRCHKRIRSVQLQVCCPKRLFLIACPQSHTIHV